MREFEEIIEEVGCTKFQRRLLYVVLSPLFFLLPLSWLNEIFLLHAPNHWCSHPSQANLDAGQLKEWKRCNLPEEYLPDGSYGPSPCNIVLPTSFMDRDEDFWQASEIGGCPLDEVAQNESVLVNCQLRYIYDQTEFISTVVTVNDWVCTNDQYVPQLFTWGIIGSILGTFLFSYLGDTIGRRLTFWLTTSIVVVFMTVKTFLVKHFVWYLVCKVLASSAYLATYTMPFSIITEISSAEYRSWAVGVSCVFWTGGLCMLPLIGWLTADYYVLSLVTVLPMALVFLGWKFVPESPRWLLTRGRKDEAATVLKEIARINNRPPVKDLEAKLANIVRILAMEKSYGYISLFRSPRLAYKILLITVALVGSSFLYYQLMLNIGNMAGNTFLNFFLLAVIELPACFIAVYLSV